MIRNKMRAKVKEEYQGDYPVEFREWIPVKHWQMIANTLILILDEDAELLTNVPRDHFHFDPKGEMKI